MAAIACDWSPRAIASAPPSVSAVVMAVLPRSLTTTDSQSLLQGHDDLSLPQTLQWLALENWLHSCAATVPTAQGWDDVKGLVEACYHGSQLKQWDLVYQLACWPIGPEQRPLYDCLEAWGQHQSQIAIFTTLQGKLGERIDLLCLDKLGHTHRHLGEYAQAQECHEAQLKLAQRMGDRAAEMNAYWGLSIAHIRTLAECGSTQRWYSPLGANKVIRSYCERYYALAHQLSNVYHQARALYEWGRTYRYDYPLGCKQGIPFLNRALDLLQTIDAPALEARVLTELGAVHYFSRHYIEGQRYLKAALAPKYQVWLAQEPDAEIWAALTLTFTEFAAGNIAQGYQGLEQVMAKCQVIQDVHLEFFALHNIAVCLSQYTPDRKAAIAYTEKALNLSLRCGFLQGALINAASLAVLHSLQQQPQVAQGHLQQAISLYHNYRPWLGREEKGIFFAYTAHVYWLQGQRLRGLFNLGRALVMLPPWSSVNGQLIWRKAVATLTPLWLQDLAQHPTKSASAS
jgi:tetratricopeptide (TPR) repeat protein